MVIKFIRRELSKVVSLILVAVLASGLFPATMGAQLAYAEEAGDEPASIMSLRGDMKRMQARLGGEF